MKGTLKALAQRHLPDEVYRRLILLKRAPKLGVVRFRRIEPISSDWGFDRGQPIDRYYIEQFLEKHAQDIHGHVLEIGINDYTLQFGGERVTRSEVLHVKDRHHPITITADLTTAGPHEIPCDTFDCIILTQTLQFIYDVPAALRTIYRILKPGGVVLALTNGITKISRYDMERFGHYWNFTSASMEKLFREVFPASNVEVEAVGNVLSAIAYLHGLASEELRQNELDHNDLDYEVIVAVRAIKPAS